MQGQQQPWDALEAAKHHISKYFINTTALSQAQRNTWRKNDDLLEQP
jgi:hypothetical protein